MPEPIPRSWLALAIGLGIALGGNGSATAGEPPTGPRNPSPSSRSVDASREAADPAPSPPGEGRPCKDLFHRARTLSLGALAYHLAGTRDIHRLMERLERVYGAVNFAIPLPFSGRRMFILQERDLVTSVMRKDSKLPYVNRNFDLSHGHLFSINAVNTTDELWKDLHGELADIFKRKRIAPIMDKYRDILVGRDEYNLNEALEEYFLKVWSEYCFGPVAPEVFNPMRDKLIETLGRVFHRNRLNRLPWVGQWTSERNYRRYREDLRDVDDRLAAILQGAIDRKEGVFYELYERLRPKYDNAFQIALDNSFLGVLVYDFISIIMLDAFAHIAKDPGVDRAQQVRQSRHDGFLYPFRFRTVDEDFDEFKRGDFCVVNLQRTGLYFSSGPRACPGAGVFSEISRHMLEIFSDYELCLVRPDEPITNTGNRDLPFMTSTHDVRVRRCPFHRGENP